MIDALLILGILGVIVVCAVLFKLMEGLSNTLLSFNIILFVMLALAGIFLFVDIKTFNDSFTEKEKIILIDQNGVLSRAFSWTGNQTKEISIEPYKDAFSSGDYSSARQKDQTIIIMKSEITQGKNAQDYTAIFSSFKRLILEYKRGNIKTEPEPFLLKAAKIIPDAVLGNGK